MMGLFLLQWSLMADFLFSSSAFSFCVLVSRPAVSFILSAVPFFLCWMIFQFLQCMFFRMIYTEFHIWCCIFLSFGWINSCWSFLCGSTAVLMLCFLIMGCMGSVVPRIYGMLIMSLFLLSGFCVCFVFVRFSFFSLFLACCFPLFMVHMGYW